MNRSALVASAFLAAMVGSPSAYAGAGTLTTTVEVLSPKVTYSDSTQTTYVGYRVTISNDGGNTINNIRFTGATTVTDPAELATFDSVEGGSCTTTNAAKTAVSCAIGQLNAGVAAPSFVIFFKAPAKVTQVPPATPVADVDGEDKVSFSGITFYAEGTGGANSVPQNSTGAWSAAAVDLGTVVTDLVKTAVPKRGGEFLTGAAAEPTTADIQTTKVKIQGAASFTTAEILEGKLLQSCVNSAYCLTHTLTIPGSFASPFLEITLRRDASTLGPGAKIDNTPIYYSPDGSSLGTPIVPCVGTGIPAGEKRCVVSRTAYPKTSTTKNPVPTQLLGDWEVIIRASENGRMGW